MPDSLIGGLPLLSSPDSADEIPTSDTSAGGIVKRMPLDVARGYILNNPVFSAIGEELVLRSSLDAGGYKLANLAAASADLEAVIYAQIKAWIGPLYLVPAVVSIQNKALAIKLSVPAITSVPGGMYLFYWCIDTAANTQITLSGGAPVASSGATVYFEGSCTNLAHVLKDAGWAGYHLHAACAYRNLNHVTDLGPTGHILISNPGVPDITPDTDPTAVDNLSFSSLDNRLVLVADPNDKDYGVQYVMELLIDDVADTRIVGNEPGLIRLGSALPYFSYDIILSAAIGKYAHARIITINPFGKTTATDTVHTPINFDINAISESLVNYLAIRIAEKVVTQSDEALKAKI